MQIKEAQKISRLASWGLGIVLFVLTSFHLVIAVVNHHATTQVRTAVYIRELYEQANTDLYAERLLSHQYLEKTRLVRPGQLAASHDLRTSLQQLAHNGRPEDQSLARQLLAEQQILQTNTTNMMDAIDNKQPVDIQRTSDQIEDTSELMETQLNIGLNRQSRITENSLSQLDRIEQLTVTIAPPVFMLGVILLTLCLYMLYTYRKRAEQANEAEMAHLEQLALTDTITQLGNYRAFLQDRTHILDKARQQQEEVVLALITIDDFTMVNEEHGFQYGDLALLEIAKLLRSLPGKHSSYRLGGNKFALLLVAVKQSEVNALMEDLRRNLRETLLNVTISIGISNSSNDAETSEQMREEAAAALHEARLRDRNTTMFYKDIGESTTFISANRFLALRNLLYEKKMVIAFQPIWDLTSNTLLSFEALTRPDPKYGFASPQEAFEMAEKIGYAHHLDYICIKAILARASELPPDTLLFVNISPQTLDHDLLTASTLVEEVIEVGLTPQRVVLEVTERSPARIPIIVRKAKELQRLGFRIALDDTGAGNAGLEMLSQLPVDFVKIDRMVVVNALSDKTARGVLTGIKTIAEEAGIYVIMEGIENVEMLQLVQEVGGQGAQGYLLGSPSPSIPDQTMLDKFRPLAAQT